MNLTSKEHETLAFIEQFISRHGYAPTMSEIADGIGLGQNSRGSVHRYVSNIAEAGFIELIAGKHRNIRLLNQPSNDWCLPVKGKIAAGQPIEAIDQDEGLDVRDTLLAKNRFLLVVKGQSMIEEGINDGDYVLCEQTQEARNGEIVVALIDKCEATLKRFYQNEDGSITLVPSNVYYQPQRYENDRIEIQGIYRGLLRFNK